MKQKLLTKMKVLLVAAGLCVGTSAWADDWSVVWTANFASAPSGITYSVTNGSTDITNGYLHYDQNGGSGNRAINTAFTAKAFNVETNWKLEFDWNCHASNQNYSNVDFATNEGKAFTITWANGSAIASITDASSNELTTKLPTLGTTNRGTATSFSHITITGNTKNGIYLTVTNGSTTYVDNVLVTSTFGYPATFNGSLGRAYSHMYIDNISFSTPAVAGFVAAPTSTITGTYNTQRKFALSCLTDNSTIYYATSDLEIGAEGWIKYTSEVTTDATTVWAYAKDDSNNTSEKMSFDTGAGTTISLATPTIYASGFTNTDGTCVNDPTFSFSCNNSAVLGAPLATLSYTFTPNDGIESSETISSSYTPTSYGTLKVIASADGYNSSEKLLVVSNLYTISYTGRDYTTATNADNFTTWGDKYDVTWTGWESGLTAYISTTTISDDNHLNIQNSNTISLVEGWGWVRGDQKTYGYRVRYAKEGDFIALKENTSKGANANATTYQTTYCETGTGAQTNLVTITAPAGYAIQQLYHYSASPTSIPVTIASSGYSSVASAYALDFAKATTTTDNADALTAYVVTEITKDAASLSSIAQAPAATGVILTGTAGATYSIPVIASAEAPATNYLQAAVTATPIEANEAYILQSGLFHKVTAASTVPAGKAYLLASNVPSEARSLNFLFADNATGITGISSELQNGEFYNLQGQRVETPTKGLYIVNGTKVIIK